MPGPSSRTDTSTRSGNASMRTQAGAPSPTCTVTLSRHAPTPRRNELDAHGPGQLDRGPGRRHVDARPPVETRRARGGEVERTRAGVDRDRVLGADQGAQGDLLLPRQATEHLRVAAQLGPPALHQGQRPGALRRARRAPAGPARRPRRRLALRPVAARRPSAGATRRGTRRSCRRGRGGTRCRSWSGRCPAAPRGRPPRGRHPRPARRPSATGAPRRTAHPSPRSRGWSR